MSKIVLAVLCALAAVHCSSLGHQDGVCSSAIKLNNKYYAQESLIAGITGDPNDLSIQDSTGDIFYTRINSEAEDEDKLKIFVLKSGSGTPVEVRGLGGLGQSTTVDNDNDIVYLASDKGLFTFNADANSAKSIGQDGTDIIHLHYSNKAVYFSVWPDYEVYKLYKNTSVSEPITIDTDNVYGNYLVVDNRENFYFVGKTNYLYFYPHNYSEKIRVQGIAKEPSTVFAIDRKDNVFVTADDKIYKVSVDNAIPQYVGSVGFDVTAFAFDSRNNIVLGKTGEIVRLNRVDC